MAQPWTESAPVDFGDFGEAGARGAIQAQQQFAEQSKNFSDLLTTNIDNVNKNKNTLQAMELLNSLDVDASKDLFKSGNIMGNIAQSIGTDNIDFNNEWLKATLYSKQKDIKDNDTANLKDLLTRRENYQLLGEDQQTLQSLTNSTLSVSEIAKVQKEAKEIFTKRALQEAMESPNNFGRSAYDIQREFMNTYKDLLDFDTVLKTTKDAIGWKETADKNNALSAVNQFNQKDSLISAGRKNPDGSPIPVTEAEFYEALNYYKLSGATPQQLAEFTAKHEQALKEAIQKDTAKRIKYNERVSMRDQDLRDATNKAKSIGESKLSGAQFAIHNIVDSFNSSDPNNSLAIDDYVKTAVPGKEGGNLRYAYNTYAAFTGMSPKAFHTMLQEIGLDPANYKSLDEFRDDLEENNAFKAFRSDLGALKSAISEMKVQYQTNVDEAHRTFNSDLYDIYNVGTFKSSGNKKIADALVPEHEQDTIREDYKYNGAGAREISNTANEKFINTSADQEDFDIRKEYGEHDILPYYDNTYTKSTVSGLTGLGIGSWLNKILKKNSWLAKNKYARLPLAIGTGIATGLSGNSAQDATLNWFAGDNRYKLDDTKVGSFLTALDYKVKKNKATQEDLATFYKILESGRSLSPKMRERAKQSLELQQSISSILNSK